MAILNETGNVTVRFGLNAEGDEEVTFDAENVSVFEAWAGAQLVADHLHQIVMGTFDHGDEDDEPDDA